MPATRVCARCLLDCRPANVFYQFLACAPSTKVSSNKAVSPYVEPIVDAMEHWREGREARDNASAAQRESDEAAAEAHHEAVVPGLRGAVDGALLELAAARDTAEAAGAAAGDDVFPTLTAAAAAAKQRLADADAELAAARRRATKEFGGVQVLHPYVKPLTKLRAAIDTKELAVRTDKGLGVTPATSLLVGADSSVEKAYALERFASGTTDRLYSSAAGGVGIDVSPANVVVLEFLGDVLALLQAFFRIRDRNTGHHQVLWYVSIAAYLCELAQRLHDSNEANAAVVKAEATVTPSDTRTETAKSCIRQKETAVLKARAKATRAAASVPGLRDTMALHRNLQGMCRRKQFTRVLDGEAALPSACDDNGLQCDHCVMTRAGIGFVDMASVEGGAKAVFEAVYRLFDNNRGAGGNLGFDAVVEALEKDPKVQAAAAAVNRGLGGRLGNRTDDRRYPAAGQVDLSRVAEMLQLRGVLIAHATTSSYTSGGSSRRTATKVPAGKLYFTFSAWLYVYKLGALRGVYIGGSAPDIGYWPTFTRAKYEALQASGLPPVAPLPVLSPMPAAPNRGAASSRTASGAGSGTTTKKSRAAGPSRPLKRAAAPAPGSAGPPGGKHKKQIPRRKATAATVPKANGTGNKRARAGNASATKMKAGRGGRKR